MRIKERLLELKNEESFGWKEEIKSSDTRPKLLIYAHYYYPDVASTGQILTELAQGLRDEFHVTVICTVPSYTGEIEARYRKHKFYFEMINGVYVLRVRVPQFRKNFPISRVINIVSYFISSLTATIRLGRQDYVFSISQPPILGGLLGVIGSKLKGAKFIYNIQDFNPEQIMAVNYSKNRLILDLMMRLDRYSCRRADRIVLVGRDMIETLKKRFANIEDVSYTHINNWIDEKQIVPIDAEHPSILEFKKKYGLKDKLVFMYSGNIGLYYDLQNIVSLFSEFKDEDDVIFAFVGEGSVKPELIKLTKEHGISNVIFIPYQDKDKLVYSLNAGDVHFVVNARGIKGVSVPSKLYGVMACAKPVLGVLEEGSEARMIIEEADCGRVVAPGDYEAIVKLIRFYIDEYRAGVKEMTEMGQRGRVFLETRLAREVSINKYKEMIMKL